MISPRQSVEQLFNAARECGLADRSAFLDRACVDSPELRRILEERLLARDYGDVSTVGRLGPPPDHNSRPNIGSHDPANVGRFTPGQVIAQRFTVIRYIARGGMGEVYEVEDSFLQGVHVALKVIRPEIADDPVSSHRFEQEVLLARKATHPNLCPIYDLSRCEEPPPPFLFLTMKLLSGDTLASRLKIAPPPSREEMISICRQMVAGVAAIHAAGVIHRDIKPNNAMLDYTGAGLCLTITDFGLARLDVSETTTLTSGIPGTPGYIAPELFRGVPPSQATDIFALGVVFQQVLTGELLQKDGLPVHRARTPEAAELPPALIEAANEFVSVDPVRRCVAFQHLRSAFEAGSVMMQKSLGLSAEMQRPVFGRRHFVLGSALTACALSGGVVWKWDSLDRRFNDIVYPIPPKRFVALLNWPRTSDARIRPMVAAAIDAIGRELERAEAFDRNLYIMSPRVDPESKTTAELNDLRDRLGANLVLAASGAPYSGRLNLSLRLLDPSSTRALRETRIMLPLDQQISLPAKAVRAAAELLGIRNYNQNGGTPDTQSHEAYAALQEAEAHMKEPNDTGLDQAIDKYKQAVELDPRYASAYAKLALAYYRSYVLRRDPAALSLARANCDKALDLNPNSVEGHLALYSVLRKTGDMEGASHEIEKALSLDPVNPRTLVYQGQLYTQLDRWFQAEEALGRVIKLRPNYWFGHNELGVAYTLQGKYEQAMKEFRSASLASSRTTLPLNNIGDVYLRQGNLAEAEDAAAKSSALQPNDLAAITLAAALRCEGKYPDAIHSAKKAVELNRIQSVGWLELGDCYSLVRGGRGEAQKAYAQAAATQEEQLATNPINGPGWMLLALCRVKSGTPETALSSMNNAAKYHSDDIDSQLYKARTLELLGNRDEALTTLALCLKRGATPFQIQSMIDMGPLRGDRRYQEILTSNASPTQAHL